MRDEETRDETRETLPLACLLLLACLLVPLLLPLLPTACLERRVDARGDGSRSKRDARCSSSKGVKACTGEGDGTYGAGGGRGLHGGNRGLCLHAAGQRLA